jgi:hypothetical protein
VIDCARQKSDSLLESARRDCVARLVLKATCGAQSELECSGERNVNKLRTLLVGLVALVGVSANGMATSFNLGDSWLSTLSYAPLFTSSPHQDRLDIFDATSASAPNGSYGGNVAVAPVPEPEIYAMMGIGLGLLGWVGRRRTLKEPAVA